MVKPQGKSAGSVPFRTGTNDLNSPLVPLVNNTDLRSPRISWSVLIMGVGVIVSIVLNYAAYDTRIAVLENAMLSLGLRNTELRDQLNKQATLFTVLSAQQSGATSKIAANIMEVNQLEKEVGTIDVRVRALETSKVGKP